MKSKSRQRPIYRMEGGSPLFGEVEIQGSKNAALPILAATLLVNGKTQICNCPDIFDVQCMKKLLEYVGCRVETYKNTIEVDATHVDKYWFPKQGMKTMRSSIVLLGAMLGRMKNARVYQPGGCLLGERPIDLHLYALKRLGIRIKQCGDVIETKVDKIKGNTITFPISSVGATQNALLAAAFAEGETLIEHASKEPEVVCLCDFLVRAGADIRGIGTSKLCIIGVEKLNEISYTIPSDRIVAGTYLFGVLGTGGEVLLKKAPVEQMQKVIETIKCMGGQITTQRDEIYLVSHNDIHNLDYLETDVYPGFPTDLQSSLLTTACVCNGKLQLKDTIFSQRFKTVEELNRMGADIKAEDGFVLIEGVEKLTGRNVIAKELRGGAALVNAGLIAEGITTVSDISYVERGYEDIVRDYKKLGAKIEKGC